MKTSIILLRYDFTEELLRLTSNAVSTLKGDEHILIDNASTIGQVFVWPDIQIKNTENIGYPAAVNQGFKLATGDMIAVANNDIRVSSNWKEVADDIFNEDKMVGTVHFRMIGYDTPMQIGYNTWFEGRERWCSASFYVIRKEAIQMYDEAYREGGCDDWDFFWRLRNKGWKTAYTTEACYQHKHSSTYIAMDDGKTRSVRDNKNREYFKSKFSGYPDDLFAAKYPEQMKENYYEFFNTL